jgi:hypothetical protein
MRCLSKYSNHPIFNCLKIVKKVIVKHNLLKNSEMTTIMKMNIGIATSHEYKDEIKVITKESK